MEKEHNYRISRKRGLTMSKTLLQVGVIGTGPWAQWAHLPSYEQCRETEVVAICDRNPDRLQEAASKFKITNTYSDPYELINNPEIDLFDISTSTPSHFPLALAVIETGKPILCEKPIAMTYKDARILQEKAAARGVKTKVAFGLRYCAVPRLMKELIEAGFIGTPYHFNGYEQNSQFIDPMKSFRWNPSNNPEKIIPGSLEEYGSHLIDLAHWMLGDLKTVIGHMKNHISERKIRDQGNKVLPINIEDGCTWLGEFQNGAQATFQTSFITIGNPSGVEICVYGSKGALRGRVVFEFGIPETLYAATPDKPEFTPIEIPNRLWVGDSATSESYTVWNQLRFGKLIQSFVDDIIHDHQSEPNFQDGAKSQEVATAVYLSHLEKRWINLPLS